MGTEEITKNFIDLTKDQDGGVIKEIISAGKCDEKPDNGAVVFVHYVGTLTDGTEFDSSRSRGEFSFTLGKGEVIKAWDLGVASMEKGEICKLTCKSSYAYGEKGSPPKIPADATLVFEIELLEFKGEDLTIKSDGGIIRKILQVGEGYSNPNEGALVEVNLVGKCGDKVFDNRKVKFAIGDGSEYNIPKGVETALEKFKKNERSIITINPMYGFGAEGNKDLGIEPYSFLEYEIHLENFDKVKEVWEMDQVEKLDKAKICKTLGTEYFTKEDYKFAIKHYKKVPDLLSYDSGLDEEQKIDSANVLKAANLNLSLCHFKLNDFINARDCATKAIEIDKTNVKGYFRRAKALMELQETSEAKNDFEKSLQLDPKNKAVAQELLLCKKQIEIQKKKDKVLYTGMFDKFAKNDAIKSAKNAMNDVMAGDLGEWETNKKLPETDASNDDDDREDIPTDDDLTDLKTIEMI